MHYMHNLDLDFKLLTVFQSLMAKRKVTDVAEELNLTQPTISRSLIRLREHFNDPLFVRTKNSMDPTPYALEIAPAIREMLDIYHTRLSRAFKFDPATSIRSFKIAGSEVGHMLLFPRLFMEFGKSAPNIRLIAVPLGLQNLSEQLETGEVDIAFGSYPKLFAGVHERRLYKEYYVCLVRKNNPSIGSKLTLTQFKQAQHIIVSSHGLGHIHEQAEKQLFDLCPEKNIKVVTHNFLVSALMVERTDFVATVPAKVAEALGKHGEFRMIEPPFKIPSFDVKLYWHERFHRDPGNQWLRNMGASCFTPLK